MVDESYSEHYSVTKLIEKVGKVSKTISSELLRAVVTLYVILQEPTVPTLTKAMIVAALGYFICPIDLIPDFLPGGLVDDLALLSAMLAQVCVYSNLFTATTTSPSTGSPASFRKISLAIETGFS